MKGRLIALLTGVLLILSACGGGEETSSTPDTKTVSAGGAEKIYTQKCMQCHGGQLEGGVGPKLSSIGKNLSQEEIEKVIADGKGVMPPGLIEGSDAKAVAKWLAAKK